MKPVVLIVDDEVAARYGIRRALEKEDYVVLEAEDTASADDIVDRRLPSVVVLDVKLATESGLDYLPRLVERRQAPVVIIITAHGSERTAVEAIKKGAYDYLAKPFDVDELRILVRNAAEVYRLRSENEQLRNELTGTETYGQLIGSSPAMARVYSLIEKVAPADINVLITGESGTGKEMVAREIHARSRAETGPFVALNCAAMPQELIESELFGHEKGAFTGAAARRIGKFELANRGTLFLDEIGDMSPATQAKVLRVIEDKQFQRLGSNETLTTDARIIGATNKDLEKEVEKGQFREDLFYRLCVVSMQLPSLRERRADIAALAQAFSDRFAAAYRRKPMRVSGDALNRLLEYRWPGNVRQLRNAIERAVVLQEGDELTLDSLPADITGKSQERKTVAEPEGDEAISVPFSVDFRDARKEFERKYIEKCLERASGNVTKAASMLGMHRQSLQHKIKELGLTKRFIINE
jgi:DNA-binding NtrC family response regulator